MTLRRKLLISFIGVASLILLVGIAGIVISVQVASSFGTVLSSTAPSLSGLLNASGSAGEMREIVYKYTFQAINLNETNPDDVTAIETNYAALLEALASYRDATRYPEYYERIVPPAEVLYQEVMEMIRLADQRADAETIRAQFEAVEAAQVEYDTVLGDALSVETVSSVSSLNSAGEVALVGAAIYIIAMISGIVAAVVLGVVVSRQIVRRVRQLQTVAEKMMRGDYSQRANMTTEDEIGQLGSAFDTMAAAIQKHDDELNALNQSLEKRVDERTKELRIATREAQEASRLKDEFLSIMSHELRTPLNAIIGFQGIILMNGGLADRPKHMLERSQANADRLLELINDILDISRIESGRLRLVNSDISPKDLLRKLQERMSVLADQKHLDFNVEIAPSVPDIIAMDEDAITKILTNLIGNAFKFTDKGSVTVRLNRRDDNLVIEVQDTGVGIPSHMHHVIFERFRQVDGSSKRAHGGSGLGLAIVQKLCVAMGGTVQVESTVGEGSTFTVVLPLDQVETMPEETEKVVSA